MESSIKSAFDSTATNYDRARRQLIPRFDDFYAAALELIRMAPGAAAGGGCDLLDLGAGTGLLAALAAAALPHARLTLVDVAPAMLDRARDRFAGQPVSVRFVTADYAREALDGPYDAIVSALSIHHLEDPAKRALFGRIRDALKPGGLFVNADQVAGATPALDRLNHESWVRRVRHLGVSEADLAAALERMKLDRPAPLAAQLQWLAQAGFDAVECSWRDGIFAVFAGFRPA
ncbi:MAG TPA: methyltransferase domain-containing protein [Candidatus Binataceae bacterium]|nr:methyltransferase domain-containing protein [Candidatus Binataceae bacterium]